MEKEKSYMLVLPQKEKQIKDVDLVMNNLKNASEFDVKSIALNEGTIFVKIEYLQETFEVEIFPDAFEMHPMYRTQHIFKDLDIKKIEKSQTGLCVAMMYSDNYLNCYHLQLKIIDCIVPDALAVLDFCSEKILSGKWVALAAKSAVPPSPRYRSSMQVKSWRPEALKKSFKNSRQITWKRPSTMSLFKGEQANRKIQLNSHFPLLRKILSNSKNLA